MNRIPTKQPAANGDAQASVDPTPMMVRRTTCRICGAAHPVPLFSLGPTPLANGLVRQEDLHRREPQFPLDVHMCATCAHVQLLDVVDPAVLFRNYVYVSGTSAAFVQHFRAYAERVAHRLQLSRGALVVDVGSNDGTLLRCFQANGYRVLGVDPALDIARTATAGGIDTIADFFSPGLADDIVTRHGAAHLVVANNVFAHVDDLLGFVRAVDRLLAPGGAFVFEVSYLVDVHEHTLFDTIYHEHLSYHTVGPLRTLFERAGMELFDVERVPSHGGSLRGYARRVASSRRPAAPAVEDLARYEAEHGFYEPATYRDLYARIQTRKGELRSLLEGLRADGKRIAGYGAPAKATTLMHAFELGPPFIEYIVDESPLKQGLFTPGFHVPIVGASRLRDDRPDYVLILAWNFADSIRARQTEFSQQGGRFIVPLPNVEVH